MIRGAKRGHNFSFMGRRQQKIESGLPQTSNSFDQGSYTRTLQKLIFIYFQTG